jgi:hypothetical protein
MGARLHSGAEDDDDNEKETTMTKQTHGQTRTIEDLGYALEDLDIAPSVMTTLANMEAARQDSRSLTPEDRAAYVAEICRALKLNPLTRPVQFLALQGREVLYLTRGATDQLAARHGLNRETLEGPDFRVMEGVKVAFCKVKATLPSGRFEVSTATLKVTSPADDLIRCPAREVQHLAPLQREKLHRTRQRVELQRAADLGHVRRPILRREAARILPRRLHVRERRHHARRDVEVFERIPEVFDGSRLSMRLLRHRRLLLVVVVVFGPRVKARTHGARGAGARARALARRPIVATRRAASTRRRCTSPSPPPRPSRR